MMNTLIVTPYYPPTINTLSNMMQELAEALTERGHNVTVATAWLKDPWNARRILKEHNS